MPDMRTCGYLPRPNSGFVVTTLGLQAFALGTAAVERALLDNRMVLLVRDEDRVNVEYVFFFLCSSIPFRSLARVYQRRAVSGGHGQGTGETSVCLFVCLFV